MNRGEFLFGGIACLSLLVGYAIYTHTGEIQEFFGTVAILIGVAAVLTALIRWGSRAQREERTGEKEPLRANLLLVLLGILAFGAFGLSKYPASLKSFGIDFWWIYNNAVAIGLSAGIAYAAYYFVVIRKRKQEELETAPEMPFKVNVAIEPITDEPALVKFIRGRKLTHVLKMDIKLGLKDWQRIKDAGLYDAVLFDYPDTTSTYSGARMTCHVRELRNPIGAGFYNIADAEEAKETLLQNLYNLKDAIEVQKEGRREESFEI